MSRNLTEILAAEETESPPTAIDVLKRAVDERGEVSDDDRRTAAEASGLPEAAVYGISSFYDDFTQPRGKRHVSVCTGTACWAADFGEHVGRRRLASSASVQASARTTASSRSARPSASASATRAPRSATAIWWTPAPGSTERVGAGESLQAPEPESRSMLDEPVMLRQGDWSGLKRAVAELGPEKWLEEMKEANVRGRGGAGFPAGVKWEFASRAEGDKVIVVNADEGDPGSYIDKLLMERNPELLLEGMALAAYAVGASRGFVFVRSEYPRSMPILFEAVAKAREQGFLGEDVLGSGFSFDVEVHEGAGSYVVGEETALLNSLMGLRGTVSARPPFPAERGWNGHPTVVNNVETLCNAPFVAARGAEAYTQLSPGATPGTKLVCFNERFENPGMYEVSFGTPMDELCNELAGGLVDGHQIKAVQIGGPLGGILPGSHAAHPLRLRRARRRGLHGRPRQHPRLRRAHRHAGAGAPPARLRRPRELRQVLPLPDRAAARAGDGRGRRPGRPGQPRRAVGDAGAGLALRARRRHARPDPQPHRPFPR